MEHQLSDDAFADAARTPVELTEDQTAEVAGGLNPQPLPPRVEPRLEF